MKLPNAKAFLCTLLFSCSAGTVSLGSIEEFSFTTNRSSLLLNQSADITISGGVAPYTINSTLHPELWTQNSSNSFTFNYNIWEEKTLPFQVIDSIGQILNTSFTLLPSAYNFSGGSTTTTTAKDFVIDSNGDLIVAGDTKGDLQDTKFGTITDRLDSIYLSKIKPNGAKDWTIQIGTANENLNIQKISLTSSHEIVILGSTTSDLCTIFSPLICSLYGTRGSLDTFVMKISSTGYPTMISQLGSGINKNTTPLSLFIVNNNILISGVTDGDLPGSNYGSTGTADAFIINISNTGTPNWTCQIGSGASTIPVSLNISGDDIFVAGYTTGGLLTHPDLNGTLYGTVGNQDAFVMKIEGSGGTPIWTSQLGSQTCTFPNTTCDFITPITLNVSNDGNIILSGTTNASLYDGIFSGSPYGTNVDGNADAFVMKIQDNSTPTPSGTLTWTAQFDSGASTTPVSLSIKDTDIIVSGFTQSGNLYTNPDFNGNHYGTEGNEDAFVIKISENDGSLIWITQLGGGNDNTTPVPSLSNTQPVALTIKDNLSGYDILLSGYSNGDLYNGTELNGTLYGSRGSQDAFVIKISENDGAPTWTSQLGTAGATLSPQSLNISNDFIYIFGQSSGAHLPGASNISTLGSTNSFPSKI